ncbi:MULTISPECIES: DUF4381 domain-containing protein [unclassified Lentimonas]|uniref:DUF4381 domain-containing protein n=1 Tax=unclassified Lentimonas TaxID=2630993 RepID=UPI00138A2C81|nr:MULTISPECIES: DUF4381 domain-containing protein [unclassified Lentimonas]
MEPDSQSLSNLHDIVVPAAPSFWPPASGFWILIALVLMLLITVVWSITQARRRNAYRRAGLTLLESATTVDEINVVLKRVALAVFPREQVAALHGEDWIQFMQATCPGEQFAPLSQSDEATPATESIRASARTWIRKHQTQPAK